MTVTNLPASVRARLRNLAERDGVAFGALLTRYALERMLHRLSMGEDWESFVLKGALLFHVWFATPTRATRDIDLLAFGPRDHERIATIFRAACEANASDGLRFDAASVQASDIRRTAGYPGIRVSLVGDLDGAQIPVQVDIGFGDAVTPAPESVTFPVLLEDMPSPMLRAYPKATAIAEKLEALVRLGRVNSRVKDHFDLWVLLVVEGQDVEDISRAVIATFARRNTVVPAIVPSGLSDEFGGDARVLAQWRAFVKRNGLAAPEWLVLIHDLRVAVMPIFEHARAGSG